MSSMITFSILSCCSHCFTTMLDSIEVMVLQLQLVICVQSFPGNMTIRIEVNPDSLFDMHYIIFVL